MDHNQRYFLAAHAMQTGVEFSKDKSDQTPKQLRVGINSAMSEHAGLATLLMEKGLFTKEEYLKAIADAMEDEAKRYEDKLAKETGTKVVLK